ncbi:MAG: YHS domain-containing (seleno)protein [Pseudomonadota bacterium]
MLERSISAAAVAAWIAIMAQTASAGNQLTVAIGDGDAVSYHSGMRLTGKARFNYFYNEAIWYFSSEKNRNKFKADPEAFAPAYDGHCAWAASQGDKAPGDPTVWSVVDGTRYMHVHPRAQRFWSADIPTCSADGNENWPRIHHI